MDEIIERYQYERRRNLTRTLVNLAVFSASIGFILKTTDAVTGKLARGPTGVEQFIFIAGMLGVAGASFALIVLYLNDRLTLPWQRSDGATRAMREYQRQIDTVGEPRGRVSTRLDLLEAEIEKLKASEQAGIAPIDTAQLIEGLVPLLVKQLPIELQQQLVVQGKSAKAGLRIQSEFAAAQERLNVELNSLRRRSAVNLAFGVVTTIAAVALLYFLVLRSERTFADMTAVVSHYLPRVSIAVFIELFAFFFLRLYRATLNEIRAYQGDITRLAIQSVAVELARSDELRPGLTEFASGLLRERPSGPTVSDEVVDIKAAADLVEKLSKLYRPKSTGQGSFTA